MEPTVFWNRKYMETIVCGSHDPNIIVHEIGSAHVKIKQYAIQEGKCVLETQYKETIVF